MIDEDGEPGFVKRASEIAWRVRVLVVDDFNVHGITLLSHRATASSHEVGRDVRLRTNTTGQGLWWAQ